jgi:hypothetical protein
MKYRIVGTDGKTYGPVGLEQIRQWMLQGRVESRTLVYVDGAASWTYLGLLPELAADFAGAPPAPAGPAAAAATPRGTNGYATAALVCSLLAWGCCCCCGLPFNLLGLVFAIVALAQISGQPEPQSGRLLAIIALILSVASLCFYLAVYLVQLATGSTSINWQTGQF